MGNRSLVNGRRMECFFVPRISQSSFASIFLGHSGSSPLITSYNTHSPLKYFSMRMFSGNEPDVAHEVYNI
jgi:hypothetical protein